MPQKDNVEDLAEKRARLRASGGEWRVHLLASKTEQQPRPMLANALLALRDAPEWRGVIGYDDFSLTIMLLRPPPWQRGPFAPGRWKDVYDGLVAEWMQRQGIAVSEGVAAAAVRVAASERPYHPVRDYLNGLAWDKKNRLENFATVYLGTADTRYSATVGRSIFLTGVARVMDPGCKADHIPILEGEQGTFKSSVLDTLFSPWFSDDLAELGSKDAQMQMAGTWCVEIAELASMRRAEVEKVKAFASRRIDRYRPSYGRTVLEAPRQCVCVGTTNAERYLKDETGGRRFLPLHCGRIDLTGVKRDRDQLWAEAVGLYRDGAQWWLDPDELQAARVEQEERFAEDAWADDVAAYVADKDEVSVVAILEHLCVPVERRGQVEMNRIAACLKAQRCWKRARTSTPPRKWVYRRVGQWDG